jgi:hypothetical protein
MPTLHPFPMQEQALALPSGRVVTVLNLVATRRAAPSAAVFSIQYRTGVPAGDAAARHAEAAEVAASYHELADAQGYTVIRSEICNTQAAAETREGPEAIFRFVRGTDGRWIASDEPGPPLRPAS